MRKIFVVDVMAMAFRLFHALSPRGFTNQAGFPTSALHGSAMFLMGLIERERPDLLILASDSEGPNFRHEIYPEYKANRGEMPEALARQIPELFRMFSLWGLPLIQEKGLEADDLIGSLVSQWADAETSCYIVSGDKDFMQLINDRVFLYAPKKNQSIELVDTEGVFRKFGCRPDQVRDVLAIWGDSSDHVPGVRGIGEKGATSLIRRWGSLDDIYQNLDQIGNPRQAKMLREQKSMAFLSRQLVTIRTDVSLNLKRDEMSFDPDQALAQEALLGFCEEMGLRSLNDRIRKGIQDLKQSQTAQKQQRQSKDPKDPEIFAVAAARGSYQFVTRREQLDAVLADLHKVDCFAFDTETSGLDLVSDRPLGVSLAWGPGLACYIPLIPEHQSQMTQDEIVALLKALFEKSEGPVKVAHNLKFDLQMLKHLGINLCPPFGDSMVAAFVLNPSRGSYGIDALSREELGIEKIPTSALMGAKKDISMRQADPEKLAIYASEDADCCLQLYQKLFPRLSGDLLRVYQDIDLPVLPLLARMEEVGISVNAQALADLSETFLGDIQSLQAQIYREAGEEFNVNSPAQLRVILFDKLRIHEQLGVTKIKKTKSGYSTDVSVLESMSSHPFVAALLSYREIYKLKNTYVDTLPQLIHETTGRIHSSFHPTGTATGRLSSSRPNLQNIPVRTARGREVRSAFVSRSGSKLISADYSQIELRILAHLSGDSGLREAFAQERDIHISTAASMFRKEPGDVSSTDRSRAKAINYGIAYGMGPQRLAKTTGVSQKEAREFIDCYFESFPGIRSFIDQAIAFATEHGYSQTICGRRRPISGLDGKEGAMAAVSARHIAVNSPIQGSAADLIKLAMIRIDRMLRERSMQAEMLLQVHDELLFECPDEEVGELCELVRQGMEQAMQLSVPLKVEVGVGNNWLEAH
ncbi:MAG: DNA polymerase I [Deltaproteobacteria bacterium]|nr:DNA polymerase I [Deltaproteobacteria bacterium]